VSELHAEDDDFIQAGNLYRDVMSTTDRDHLASNIVTSPAAAAAFYRASEMRESVGLLPSRVLPARERSPSVGPDSRGHRELAAVHIILALLEGARTEGSRAHGRGTARRAIMAWRRPPVGSSRRRGL